MPGSRDARPYRHAEDAAWQVDELRPDILGTVYRYKTLLGIPELPCPDAAMGILELNPGTYPFHEHPAPEAYYVLRGRAAWTVGKQTFQAREGTAIYHLPGILHRMVNHGDEPLVALWFWWAPGGRASVLREPSRLSPRSERRGTAQRER